MSQPKPTVVVAENRQAGERFAEKQGWSDYFIVTHKSHAQPALAWAETFEEEVDVRGIGGYMKASATVKALVESSNRRKQRVSPVTWCRRWSSPRW